MNVQKSLNSTKPPHLEKVYVKVNSDFDSTGYMQPKSITWKDGRTFIIEAVKDYRPAAVYRKGVEGACYTVMIKGEERHLFCEWTNSAFASRVARWYVEAPVPDTV